jgi:hypothetical protein
MLIDTLDALSVTNRESLLARKITRQLIANWRLGHGLPNPMQVTDLAAITGRDAAALQAAVVILRTPINRRLAFEQALKSAQKLMLAA